MVGYAATLGQSLHFHQKDQHLYVKVGGEGGNRDRHEDPYRALVVFTIITCLLDIISDFMSKFHPFCSLFFSFSISLEYSHSMSGYWVTQEMS